MTEIWRTVDVCPAYEVSSDGRIRRALPGKRTRVGNIVRSEGDTRYRTATLVFKGKRHYVQIHTLVCRTFHGAKPSPDHQAAHLNGDSHDNRARNLAWATQRENERHKAIHGTRLVGEDVPGAKLTVDDVLEIRRLHSNGEPFAAIGRRFGVYYTTVRRIVTRKTWKHIAD